MEIKEYIKKKNAYNPLDFKANKKISAEEWNALWLSTIYQGNYQDEALDYVINEVLEAHNVELGNKVGRVDVNNIPENITYNADGDKSLNNLYYNFTHSVEDKDYPVKGALLVLESGSNQVEFFFTEDGVLYSRKNSGVFKNVFKQVVMELAYTKEQSDERFVHLEGDENIEGTKTFEDSPNIPTPTLDEHPVNKLYLEDNYSDKTETAGIYYNKDESDTRFVHLEGNESIDGVKTFIDKILVEDPTANKMPVNKQTMEGYTYSKKDINNLTTPIGFETEQNFLDWLSGTFTRTDEILPSDLLIGKKIIIQEEGKNNYQVAEVPVDDLSDFKVLVEDNKFAEEIGFKPYETINADNIQDAVEEVKDEVDLKTQIVRLDNLVIESNEWVEESGEVYFDHMIPEFTNSIEQEIEIVNNNKTQSDLFIAEQITVKAVETIGVEPNLGIRLVLNKAPSETITLSVFMSNSTNITFEAGEVVAKNVFYDNTASDLIADNVQDVVDELSQRSNNINGSLMDLEDRVDDLESEIIDKADTSYVDAGLAGKASTSALNLKADKTYVDNFKLYNHKIILNNIFGNNSYFVFVNLILNTNVEITTLSDLNTKILSIYGSQSIPATGTFHTTVDDKYWYNINSISSIGNGLRLGGMGYQNLSSSDLKPYITQTMRLDGEDGWTLYSDTVVELN